MKPHIQYAEFQAARLPEFGAMKDGDPLLLDGQEVEYAGHHFDSLVWLRIGKRVETFRQREMVGRLRIPSAKRNKERA